MSGDRRPPSPTIIPVPEEERDEVHRATTVLQPPPSAPAAASAGPRSRPPGTPQPARARPARKRAPNGFLGLGPAADVMFGVILSLVFAAGIGIGAALVTP